MASGIDFAALGNNAASNNSDNNTRGNKPDAMIWGNIGFYANMPVYDAEGNATSETEQVFISLPYGIPLDTMNPASTKSSNKRWAAQQDAKNKLLANLLEKAHTMEPGETFDATGLTLQVRRAAEATEVESDDDLISQVPSFA